MLDLKLLQGLLVERRLLRLLTVRHVERCVVFHQRTVSVDVLSARRRVRVIVFLQVVSASRVRRGAHVVLVESSLGHEVQRQKIVRVEGTRARSNLVR